MTMREGEEGREKTFPFLLRLHRCFRRETKTQTYSQISVFRYQRAYGSSKTPLTETIISHRFSSVIQLSNMFASVERKQTRNAIIINMRLIKLCSSSPLLLSPSSFSSIHSCRILKLVSDRDVISAQKEKSDDEKKYH